MTVIYNGTVNYTFNGAQLSYQFSLFSLEDIRRHLDRIVSMHFATMPEWDISHTPMDFQVRIYGKEEL